MYRLISIFIFFLSLISIFSCKKDEDNLNAGEIEVIFDFLYDNEPLNMNMQRYLNAAGEEFTIEKFKLYISNVKLLNNEGVATYIEQKSYHLLGAGDNEKKSFILKNVPKGTYTSFVFSIGVDPLANASTDNPGDLDPSNEMVWDWNTGYKFLSLTGRFFPSEGNRGLVIHLGTDPFFKTFNFDIPQILNKLIVIGNNKKIVRMGVEVKELFQNPNLIKFKEKSSWMHDPESELMAQNYSNGFFFIRSIDD
jgi:hypothetical protein